MKKWINDGNPTKTFEKKFLGNQELWAYKPKRGDEEAFVYVPRSLREELTEWYHDTLKHPGSEMLLSTMQNHFN